MRDFSQDRQWLSINTATLRQWTLPEIIDGCARAGISTISPWRDQVANVGLALTTRLLRDAGMSLSGYCRGGMFTAPTATERNAAHTDNLRAVDEAVMLGAPCLVLVVGGLPGALQGKVASRDLGAARSEVTDAIGRLLDYARTASMPLAIEPLHPMYAADRACINTMDQALDVCDSLDPGRTGALGVAVDCYHVWWDPKLESAIARAMQSRLLAFHICDWLSPTRDLLEDRGMMGDGVIDIPRIRGWMERAGYLRHTEVEIFSSQNWWKRPGDEVLRVCKERYASVV